MSDLPPPPAEPVPVPETYRGLRLSIRATGVLVMLGGLIYLGAAFWTLIGGRIPTEFKPSEMAYGFVVALLALGIGYFVLRVGWAMLNDITPSTVSSFSFLFALIYTPILFRLLPVSPFLAGHGGLVLLLPFLYFVLTYLILKRILLFLLFPSSPKNSTRL